MHDSLLATCNDSACLWGSMMEAGADPRRSLLRISQKIRARFLATPDKSATLESLLENEKGEKKRTATEGLLWLTR